MRNSLFKHVAYVFVAILSIGIAAAQSTVSGVVSDDGGPLPGVNIVVKGTSNGTTTDIDGSYTISDVPSNGTLVFSYVGYDDQEVAVGGRSSINVTLAAGQALSTAVLNVGYGTIRVKDATGSVVAIGEEDFNKGVTTSPNELLQGRVAGVNVTASSGEPGGASSIRVRGTSSPRAGNDPLFVIDGVPINSGLTSAGGYDLGFGTSSARNPLSFINSSDIESMNVLKDASATAIYGSRGANGVIIVTTKKPKTGAARLTYSGFSSTSKMYGWPDVLSADDFLAAGGPNFGGRTDTQKLISRQAFSFGHNASLSFGNETGAHRLSLGMQDLKGVIKNSGQTKYTANLSSSFKFFDDDRLRVDVNLYTSFIRDDFAPISNNAGYQGSLIGAALQWVPTQPIYNADGSYNQYSADNPNPVAFLDYYKDFGESSRILGNLTTSFDIIDGLTYKFLVGIDRLEGVRRTSVSPNLVYGTNFGVGAAAIQNNYGYSKTFTNTLNYSKEFSDNFSLDALLGYEYISNNVSGNFTSTTGYNIDPGYLYNFIGGGTNRPVVGSYNSPTDELNSYFARVNMNIKNRYLLTATMRADGSSKFGINNRYGYFPSVGGAWKISEEDFVGEAVSDLKLRAGWGLTGNSSFPAGAAQERYSYVQGAATLINVANPDLKWETVETINVGLDWGFSNNRYTGSIEWFDKKTKDLLFQRSTIQPAPATTYWVNLPGQVSNTGVEISINAAIVDKENTTFELGGNVAFLNNKMKNYPLGDNEIQTGLLTGQGLSGATVQRIANNQPINAFYLAEYEGLDSSGNSIYKDINGDGVGDAATDLAFVGDPNPNTLLGIRAYFRYKKFDVTANMNGAYGHQIYNETKNALFFKGAFPNRNYTKEFVDNGESGGNPNSKSTRYLESGDFLRMSNLTLGYNVEGIADWISDFRFTLTGQNLFVITPYNGFDPEVNTDTSVNGVSSFGIEYTPYPKSRTVTLGLNVSF